MAKQVWSYESGVITRDFEDGLDSLTFDVKDFCVNIIWGDLDEVEEMAIVNGLKQKLADILAVPKTEALSEVEKRNRLQERWTDISNNRNWNVKGVTRGPSVSLKLLVPALVQAGLDEAAIATATGRSVEVIVKFIETGEE